MKILGIDIGGTGIKGAPVDLEKGRLLAERFRILTPQPATPKAIAGTVSQIVKHFRWKGPLGCTFPGVVKNGTVFTAANVDKSWLGVNAAELFRKSTKCPATVLNDADAAGIAEMKYGAGKGKKGVTFLVTLGTGIGSALFYDDLLIPNTELGHLEVRGKDAELRASERIREAKEWSWKKWGHNVDEYLKCIEALLWPDLIIVGGGVSKKFKKFSSHIHVRAAVVPAKLENEAGIVGAALAASVNLSSEPPKGKVSGRRRKKS